MSDGTILLLLQLARRMGERFVVVTRQNLGELPPNVEQMRGDWHAQALSDAGLRKLYQEAMLVVTPLQDSVQPSGQSVCLQAMACGKPVVLTRTTGLWSQEMMRDGENVLLVPPGDLTALQQAVSSLLADPGKRQRLGESARRCVCDCGDISLFALRLEAACQTGCHACDGLTTRVKDGECLIMQIVCVVLVRNEERFIATVLGNIVDFCDKIIVVDDVQTRDDTGVIVRRMMARHDKISYVVTKDPGESHTMIQQYAGTDTWLFAVDGDEIYDPEGLAPFSSPSRSG